MMFGFTSSSSQPQNHHLFSLDEGETSALRLNTSLKWHTSKLDTYEHQSNVKGQQFQQLLKESLLDENPEGKTSEECKVQNSLKNKVIRPVPQNTRETYKVDFVKGLLNDTIAFNIDGTYQLSSKFSSSILSQKVDIFLRNTLIAKMQGNFLGSLFNIYISHNNIFQLVGTITYESKISLKKLPRKITLYLNHCCRGIQGFSNLKEAYGEGKYENDIIKLELPDSSFVAEKGKGLPLQKDRVSIIPSIHNSVFVNRCENRIVFKLYKVSEERYEVVLTHPMSVLMSYCFMLTSFSFKLISQ